MKNIDGYSGKNKQSFWAMAFSKGAVKNYSILRDFFDVWPLTPDQFLPNSGRYFAWLRSENGLTQVKKLSNSIYRQICGTDWPEKCRKIPEYTSAYFSTVRHNNSRPPTQCFLWKTSVLYVALHSLMAFCATFQHNWRAKSYVLKKAILQQSMFQGQISKPFFEIGREVDQGCAIV